MKKLLYITQGSNDFTDDMLFMGLESLLDEYDVYFAISGCEFGYPKTIEERAKYIFYSWKDDWIKVAKKLKNIDDYPNVEIDIVIIGQAWIQNQVKYFEIKKQYSSFCKVLQVFAIDDSNPPINIATNPDHIFYTNNSNEQMRINNSGNISIGNTSDIYKLNVNELFFQKFDYL